MQQVSSHFLEQTLDKKLMSDLRVWKCLRVVFFNLYTKMAQHLLMLSVFVLHVLASGLLRVN